MTIQQLRLSVEIAKKGSISSAAQSLKVSQPNASLSIKKLEKELGYPVFIRQGNNCIPTEQGYRFLSHAETIVREDRALREINENKAIPRLRLGTMNFSPATGAFISYCKENREAMLAELTCVNVALSQGMALLNERELDLVVSIQIKQALPMIEKLCRDYKLEYQCLRKLQLCVRMRKDHPLIMKESFDGSMPNLKKLNMYPCVEYKNYEALKIRDQSAPATPFGCSYVIYTDERDSRLSLVGSTDAYNIGIQTPEYRKELYGLAEFPIGKDQAYALIVHRKGDRNLPGIRRYLELLDKEIDDWCSE